MSARGGRDRLRRDHPSRYEDKSISTWRSSSNNPPSRHLWVGNLPHNIVEDDVAHHFLRFGPLESIAFQPGRSYAFINFKRDEDAIDALKALQGFPLAGNPLRIEFAKADKPLMVSRDEDSSWDERSPALRESPFNQREFRGRHGSPEPLYSDKSKLSDKNPEPSEVLWIGFPSQLKVDEFTLRKAFSPFGEIEKITTFPGRSYAFVRFRSLMSACRAKETLQGKLFGNPRVHICFAKSDTGSSGGRNSINAPPSPFYKPSGRQRSPESLRQERNFVGLSGDHSFSPPKFSPNWDPGDSDAYEFSARGSSWAGGTNTYEQRRVGEKGLPLGISREIYDHSSSPSRDRLVHMVDLPQRIPLKGALFEDPRNFPEDDYLHDAKRIKTGSFPPEDIPDYPLSDLGRQKHAFSRILSDFPQPEVRDKSFDAGPYAYRQTPDHIPNSPIAGLDRIDQWQPYDGLQMGHGALQSNPVEKRKLTPEPRPVSAMEWKWEGTIAKGGTPVCRARCFPVGKALDILLPEFLDCTARTGLDMLSKHYYQAAGAWVVFFVPESDAEIGFYNEFMHYLEEKQRAAVAKLDDRNTLFLVPPSDFSEKVLKVPGKLSISGVVLRLEHPSSNHGPMHDQKEIEDVKLSSYHGDTFYPKPSVPSAVFPPTTSVPELGKSGMSNLPFLGNKMTSAPPTLVSGSVRGVNITVSHDERRHDYPNSIQQQKPMSGPNWSSPHLQNLISNRSLPMQISNGGAESVPQEHQQFMYREMPDANPGQRTGGISGIPLSGNSKSTLQEIRPMDSSSISAGALQPEQLAQLASLLGQKRQSGNSQSASTLDDPRQINRVTTSDTSSGPSQKYAVENNNPVKPELSNSQLSEVLQLQKQQQMSNVPQVAHREPQRGASENQQMINSGLQQDAGDDPQKRLQATLQLAAALLQQIQQGK
ncbi:hypothetical protein L6164_028932 [Bauhinia variegata]|uniref:Uncharacterized protein n=1 Tax=Bauhinia variegata TaxID=167791 RepID=A0ACB9L8D5_BAUVA|nr:hypothetical protein L6164_028932 [Bauhinia variegata]